MRLCVSASVFVSWWCICICILVDYSNNVSCEFGKIRVDTHLFNCVIHRSLVLSKFSMSQNLINSTVYWTFIPAVNPDEDINVLGEIDINADV